MICILTSCALTSSQLSQRSNETKIRNRISSNKAQLKICAREHINKEIIKLDIMIRVGVNKQVSFFSVNSGNAPKRLTDCFFKVLDLIYFEELDIKRSLSLNYSLYLK